MGDIIINKNKVNIILYGEANLLRIFGTTEVDNGVLFDHCRKLWKEWDKEELIVEYNKTNLEIVLREKRSVGNFEMMYEIVANKIHVRAKEPADLTYLQLKYKF